MEVIFRNPLYLWALVVIPIIIVAHYFSVRYSHGRAIKFANFVALARVSQRVSVTSHFPVLVIRVLIFVSIVFAITGTTIYYSGTQTDADYILAIDASASMLAEDFFPTRFEAAKVSALQFVEFLPSRSSVGVIGFSGTSYVHQTLTNDKNLAKIAVNRQEILASGGTSIGDAVITGTNLLVNSLKSKVIIILTDGRSNVGVSQENAVAYANNQNVIVHAIGIGTEEDYFVDVTDVVGPLGLDTEELEKLTSATGGTFYNPGSPEDLTAAYKDIATSVKKKSALDLTFYLLAFLMVALFMEWLLVNTRYKVIP